MSLEIDRQLERFDSFREERLPVLLEFAEGLGFQRPHEILSNPEEFVEPVSKWLSKQEISNDSKSWIAVRIGYLLGELFVEKHGGCWSVCEASGSRYYGRYVVSEFSSFNNANALFDPMEVASDLASQPKGRSLIEIVNEIEHSLGRL